VVELQEGCVKRLATRFLFVLAGDAFLLIDRKVEKKVFMRWLNGLLLTQKDQAKHDVGTRLFWVCTVGTAVCVSLKKSLTCGPTQQDCSKFACKDGS
jgi:hypothetical protein